MRIDQVEKGSSLWKKMINKRQRMYRRNNGMITIPHEVVEKLIDKKWTLLKAWRVYLKKKNKEVVMDQILAQLEYKKNDPRKIQTPMTGPMIFSIYSWYDVMERSGRDDWKTDKTGRKIMPLTVARFLAKILGIDYRQLRLT